MTRRRSFRLVRLEDRLAPAIATWDGGGADNHWTTAANWAGDVAPSAGDDLVFPSGAAQLANVNDFAAGTAFGRIFLAGTGYQFTGNAITHSGGIAATILIGSGSNPAPSLAMDITLSAPQSFTVGVESVGFMLAGALNLNGNNLAATTGLTISGPISGAGSLTIS